MNRRHLVPALLVLAVSGCGISVTPRVQSGAPLRGDLVSGAAVEVEYTIRCSGCYIEYTTPTGAKAEEDVARARRHFWFYQNYGITTVTLRAVPQDSSTIESVVIMVNGQEAASSLRVRDSHAPGQTVVINAILLSPG